MVAGDTQAAAREAEAHDVTDERIPRLAPAQRREPWGPGRVSLRHNQVPTAREALRWATVWEMAGTGGKSQLHSPCQGTEKASVQTAAG